MSGGQAARGSGVRKPSGLKLLGLLSALSVGFLLILPIAVATTFSAPYSNSAAFTYPFTTGPSAVNGHGLFSPNKITGKTVFWHNSTVGQLGPAKAEFGALQGFGASPTFLAAGTHSVTVTWASNGEAVIGVNCFGSGGAAQAVVTEKVEVNLLNTGNGKWLLANNAVSQVWTHSVTTCGSWSYYTLSGSSVVGFAGITVPAGGGNYAVWGYLYTNTTAIESSGNDATALSCIDYALNTTSCYGNVGATGNAALSSIIVV